MLHFLRHRSTPPDQHPDRRPGHPCRPGCATVCFDCLVCGTTWERCSAHLNPWTGRGMVCDEDCRNCWRKRWGKVPRRPGPALGPYQPPVPLRARDRAIGFDGRPTPIDALPAQRADRVSAPTLNASPGRLRMLPHVTIACAADLLRSLLAAARLSASRATRRFGRSR